MSPRGEGERERERDPLDITYDGREEVAFVYRLRLRFLTAAGSAIRSLRKRKDEEEEEEEEEEESKNF